MGANPNPSIIRTALSNKAVTADTAILVAADVERNQPDKTGNYIYSNMTKVVCWTVECSPSVDGFLSVIFNDGTTDLESIIGSGSAGKMLLVEFFLPAAWPINLKYSADATMSVIAITEHGGIY